jgi:acyl carrier protein
VEVEEYAGDPGLLGKPTVQKQAKISKTSNLIQDGKAVSAQDVRKVIAEELGVDVDELNDDIALVDYGVDSLMLLTISGRLAEDHGLVMDLAGLDEDVSISQLCTKMGLEKPQPVPIIPPRMREAKVSAVNMPPGSGKAWVDKRP